MDLTLTFVSWELLLLQGFWLILWPLVGLWFGHSIIANSRAGVMVNPLAGTLFAMACLVVAVHVLDHGVLWTGALLLAATAAGIWLARR